MGTELFRKYIAQQPALWKALLGQRERITAGFAALFHDFRPDRVVCIGSGSSHYAALMARPVLEAAWKCEVNCVVPSAFSPCPAAVNALYLAVSQSGVSSNTHEIICRLRAEGRPVVAVTENAASPCGQAASLAVPLLIGEERVGAKTKGVTATVLTLMLLALSVGGDAAYAEALGQALDRLCANAEENFARAARWSRAQRDAVLPFRHLYVLGSGNALGAAQEGALKLLETNYIPVSCYAFDEYLHGIQNALDENACLICLVPQAGTERERMLRLVDFARAAGAECLVMTTGAPPDSAALALLDAGHEALEALVLLPALQALAAELSDARGIDVSSRRYPDFFALMGSKMETL